MAWAWPQFATLATYKITILGKLAGIDGGILGLPIPGVSFGKSLYTLVVVVCKLLELGEAWKYLKMAKKAKKRGKGWYHMP